MFIEIHIDYNMSFSADIDLLYSTNIFVENENKY